MSTVGSGDFEILTLENTITGPSLPSALTKNSHGEGGDKPCERFS